MAESQEQQIVIVRPNVLLATLRQPRVMLFLLAGWAILGAITEFFSSSFIFDLHGDELDGALGGRALSAEAIPLAVLYLYAARDPQRYRGVFWIALIEQAVAIVANVYHWGAGDFSFESVVLPLAVAGGFIALIFLHLFAPQPAQAPPPPQAPSPSQGTPEP